MITITDSTWLGSAQPSRGKLTRRFFQSLETGATLVSNTFDRHYQPVFCETVQPDRDAQWRRIKVKGADGRTCHVFATPEAAREWLSDCAMIQVKQWLEGKKPEGLHLVIPFNAFDA